MPRVQYPQATTHGEKNRLAVARSYFKTRGMLVDPLRIELVWAVYNGCKGLLKMLPAKERRALLKILVVHFK